MTLYAKASNDLPIRFPRDLVSYLPRSIILLCNNQHSTKPAKRVFLQPAVWCPSDLTMCLIFSSLLLCDQTISRTSFEERSKEHSKHRANPASAGFKTGFLKLTGNQGLRDQRSHHNSLVLTTLGSTTAPPPQASVRRRRKRRQYSCGGGSREHPGRGIYPEDQPPQQHPRPSTSLVIA
jgi:hypothetical protein